MRFMAQASASERVSLAVMPCLTALNLVLLASRGPELERALLRFARIWASVAMKLASSSSSRASVIGAERNAVFSYIH
jgi:hypothetical protein